MFRRTLLVCVLLVLAGVQVGLAHAAVCADLMTPQPPPARQCHTPAPESSGCHDMAGCSDLCDAVSSEWAAPTRDKASDRNPLDPGMGLTHRDGQDAVPVAPEFVSSPLRSLPSGAASPAPLYLSTGALLI